MADLFLGAAGTPLRWNDAKEFGEITQHIGAYEVDVKAGNTSGRIVFLVTPGHEAFTAMRARGAQVTDIVVLIIAADDGIMPQTAEAIDHARAAEVPIIVAINKIDKDNANPDQVKQQMANYNLIPEDWGGETVSVEISATEKTNLSELLEMILLLSDMIELKANPTIEAQGIVLEARLDATKGPVATVIILHGTLKQGQSFISGNTFGKARALFDEHGKPLKDAGPSSPVEVLGFTDVPSAGDVFQVIPDPDKAKRISQIRNSQIEKKEVAESPSNADQEAP